MKKWIVGIASVVLIAVLIFTNGFGIFGSNNLVTTGYAVALGDIGIPLSDITETAKWYEYDSDGVKIKFFAVKASDGSIKTAFDSCDVCYSLKKGYRQEGDYLVCNNCGRRFAISGLGTENRNPYGCWPGYLPSSVESGKNENLVIKKSDLENGRWRF